jgi:hypothetical protein
LDFLKAGEDQVATNNRGDAAQFERLVGEINGVLEQYGKHDSLEPGDYSIYEDYWGFAQVKVSINDLKMLEPALIERLREVVTAYPGWEIVVAVVLRDHYSDWPEMGLFIRQHEIIDGLQRQYFPKEFQNLTYAGARPGTARD